MGQISATFWADRSDVKIDPTTGMPEVPEGFYWKIGKSSNDYDQIYLRERIEVPRSQSWVAFVRFFGVKLGPKYRIRTQDEGYLKLEGIGSEEEYKIRMIDKAYYILSEEKQRNLAERATVNSIRSKYYGPYPPKTMN